MGDRAAAIAGFLKGTPWESWSQEPVAGDASARRYVRLHQGARSVILMDAPPDTDLTTGPFVALAQWLRAQDLSAPEIYKHAGHTGLIVMEDLGDVDMARQIQTHPEESGILYQAATDVLIHLNGTEPPPGLAAITPEVGGQMLNVTSEWYAANPENQSLALAMSNMLARLCAAPDQIALRDYHAENLIWRPDRTGLHRMGILDFQDAFLAPRGYDLVSLLRDVRRVVHPDICTAMTKRFEAATAPLSDGAFACLAAQRNLRILGVFARLALRDGKRRYVQMIPHLWEMITKDLANPALSDLKAIVDATLPPPQDSAIKDLL